MLLPDHRRGTAPWQGFHLFQNLFTSKFLRDLLPKESKMPPPAKVSKMSINPWRRKGRKRKDFSHLDKLNSTEPKWNCILGMVVLTTNKYCSFDSSAVSRKESGLQPPDGKEQCSSFKCYESRISSCCQQEWSNHLGRMVYSSFFLGAQTCL